MDVGNQGQGDADHMMGWGMTGETDLGGKSVNLPHDRKNMRCH